MVKSIDVFLHPVQSQFHSKRQRNAGQLILVIQIRIRYIFVVMTTLKLKTIHLPLVCCLAIAGALLSFSLTSCGGAKETAHVARPPARAGVIQEMVSRNRDLAIQHFIDGSIYDLKEDYAKAVLEYQDALRFDSNAAIYYALSKDYSNLGKLYLAAENGRVAVQLDPENTTCRENLAEVYVLAHEIDSAITQYQEILKIDSNSTRALYGIAQLYQQQAKPLEAITAYKKILHQIGPEWDVLVQLTQLYEGLQRYSDAADAYQQMLNIDPSNLDLRKRLVETYLRASKPDSALARLNEILDIDRKNPDIEVLIGDIYLQKNETAKALEYYDLVLKQDSATIETKIHIPEALLERSQKDSSLVGYAKPMIEAIRNEWPNDWRPYWFLGFIGFSTRSDSFALANFRKVTELNPGNGDAWYYVGTIYFRMEQNDSAARALEKSTEINPRNVDFLGALALTYDSMKRYADSDRTYEEALKLDPHSHIILNNYSYSLAERGTQLDRALQMAKEAVEKQPENSSYLDTIGWINFKLGKYDEARKYIEKAVQLRDAVGENGATLNEHLGDVFYKLDKKEKALEFWKRALEMNQKNQTLKAKIERGTLE
jgi:tetratricopeptide (TPR) repeat protein